MTLWGLLSLSYVSAAFIVVYLFLFLSYYVYVKRRTKLPPGPSWSLPLLGNIPFLMMEFYRTGAEEPEYLLANMAKKYGEIFSLKIGTKLVVVANGYKTIAEGFKNHHMNDRPESKMFKECEIDEGEIHTSTLKTRVHLIKKYTHLYSL